MLKRIGAEEGGEFKAVASGTLPCGRPVIIKADGTVSVVAESTTSAATGSTNFNEIKNFVSAAYDSGNDRVVIAYADETNSNYGTVIAGTVNSSDLTISFGSTHVFYNGYARDVAITYDSNAGKCVIGWYPFPNARGDAVVATVNPANNSVSTGSVTSFESSLAVSSLTAVYAPDQQKVIFTYYANSVGRSIVGTVSGTSISFGSHVVYNNATTYNPTSGYDTTNNRLLVGFRDQGNSGYGTAMVGTVSGTSISFGSEYVWTSNSSFPLPSGGITHDTVNNKNVVFYVRGGTAYARVITIDTSNNSISYGTEVQFRNYSTGSTGAVVFNQQVGKFEIINSDETDNYKTKLITGTVSGTDISFGTDTIIDTDATDYFAGAYNSTLKNNLFAYKDSTNNGGRAFVSQLAFTETNLTSENYIGMSRGPASPNSVGSETEFINQMGNEISAAVYDPDSSKVILAYSDSDNSTRGTAIVGTVSGTSISFGTPVVYNSSETSHIGITYDTTNDKVVIVYRDGAGSNNYGNAIVGSVSGTNISFGSAAVYNSANSQRNEAAFDTNTGKVVIVFLDSDGSVNARVATVSGTSISYGTEVQVASSGAYIKNVFDSNSNKVVVLYRDGNNSNYGTARVGTVSGTDISFGTAVVFHSAATGDTEVAFDSTNNKIVIGYKDGADGDKGNCVVGTVSGTSISFGSEATFHNASTLGVDGVVYNSNLNKVFFFYTSGSSIGRVVSGTVSGTTVGSFGSEFTYHNASTNSPFQVYDVASTNIVAAYRDGGDSNKGKAVVFKPELRGEVASGQAASIDIIGSVSDNQGSLTAGQQYFVQTDGTISTTAGSPSVLAGTAISATELVVKT